MQGSAIASVQCTGRVSCVCDALMDEDIWVDPPAGEDEHGMALYVSWKAARLFQEYMIQAMAKTWFIAVQVGAQTLFHFFVAGICDGARE